MFAVAAAIWLKSAPSGASEEAVSNSSQEMLEKVEKCDLKLNNGAECTSADGATTEVHIRTRNHHNSAGSSFVVLLFSERARVA